MHALVEIRYYYLEGDHETDVYEKLDEIPQTHRLSPYTESQKVRPKILYHIFSVKVTILSFEVLFIAQVAKLDYLEGRRYLE